MLDKISYSTIFTFDQCKQHFKYMYVDKLPPDEKIKHISGIFGTIMHNTLGNFYLNSDFSFEQLRWTFFDEFMKSVKTENLDYTKITFDKLIARGYSMITKFYDVQKKSNLLVRPEFVEKPFKIYSEKLGIFITGRIDIGIDGWVEDFKTDAKPDHKRATDTLQLTIYSFAYRKLMGKKEKGVCLFFLEDGKKDIVTRESKDFKVLKDKIVEITSFVKNAKPEEYTKNTSNCFFCEYKSRCNKGNQKISMSFTEQP